MKKLHLLTLAAAMLLMLTAIPSLSQAQEFEARASLGVSFPTGKDQEGTSIAATLSGGARFLGFLGVYLDVGVGGVDMTDDNNGTDYFITVMPTARVFSPIPLGGFDPYAGIGIGYYRQGYDFDGASAHWSSWYSMKYNLGVTYNLLGFIGVGINFEYYLSLGGDACFEFDGKEKCVTADNTDADIATLQAIAVIKF